MQRTLSHEDLGQTRARRSPATPLVLVAALVASITLGCEENGAGEPGAGVEAAAADSPTASFEWPDGQQPLVTLELADRDVIVLELYPEIAAKTVDNFLRLADRGFYDGTTFHRVIPGFMIQGGDPNTRNTDPNDDGKGGPDYKISDEFNAAPHDRGTLSMANNGTANSGGSQFFIVHEDSRHLDGHHTVFGRVRAGMDVVDAITNVEIDVHGRWGARNRPVENIVIEHVVISNLGNTAVTSTASDDMPASTGIPAGAPKGDVAG